MLLIESWRQFRCDAWIEWSYILLNSSLCIGTTHYGHWLCKWGYSTQPTSIMFMDSDCNYFHFIPKWWLFCELFVLLSVCQCFIDFLGWRRNCHYCRQLHQVGCYGWLKIPRPYLSHVLSILLCRIAIILFIPIWWLFCGFDHYFSSISGCLHVACSVLSWQRVV
jgi:hypothetical protein